MLLDIYDPKAPPTAIGIDLGTTNSIVSYVRDERPLALTNCDGKQLLPSAVYFGAHGEVIVGTNALSYLERHPTRTIVSVKRFMGRAHDDAQTRQLGAHKFSEPKTAQDHKTVRFDLGERQATPVEVSAEILKSLVVSAREQLNAVGGAVITVPAYFDDAQRQATRDAGRLAGLEVLRLLNEPTAAALAYGVDSRQNGVFAVYDLGGGTFDITILRLESGVFQVKSTGGDSALGGDDMDRLVAHEMLTCMGFVSNDPPKEVVGLVLGAARDAKHALTERQQVTVELPRKGGGTANYELSREHFDALIEPLLRTSGRACRRALRDAELEAGGIDGVLLVGGSTRVPRVRSFVEEIFGRAPLTDVDPDLAVAHGAAIQAKSLTEASEDVLLLDVIPLSLGIETMGGVVDRILPRNTTIPAGAKSSFTTYADNQTGFEVHVVQGERELAEDCRSLAKFTLRGVPPMPAGQARLEVHFGVDENGLLEVSAKELTTGIEQRIDVQPSYGLDDEQVEQMLLAALDHGEEDLGARRLRETRVEGRRLLLATEKAMHSDASLLSAEELQRASTAIEELRSAIDTAVSPARIQACIDGLDAATHAWAGRRMDAAIRQAIGGKSVTDVEGDVEDARGVEAHLQEHRNR